MVVGSGQATCSTICSADEEMLCWKDDNHGLAPVSYMATLELCNLSAYAELLNTTAYENLCQVAESNMDRLEHACVVGPSVSKFYFFTELLGDPLFRVHLFSAFLIRVAEVAVGGALSINAVPALLAYTVAAHREAGAAYAALRRRRLRQRGRARLPPLHH